MAFKGNIRHNGMMGNPAAGAHGRRSLIPTASNPVMRQIRQKTERVGILAGLALHPGHFGN